ncbi:Uncharacterised protein [Candidatus Burarchaeum australiense]|nr:Uncharacterised protein [Candidatus Burarchaeum australiense]
MKSKNELGTSLGVETRRLKRSLSALMTQLNALESPNIRRVDNSTVDLLSSLGFNIAELRLNVELIYDMAMELVVCLKCEVSELRRFDHSGEAAKFLEQHKARGLGRQDMCEITNDLELKTTTLRANIKLLSKSLRLVKHSLKALPPGFVSEALHKSESKNVNLLLERIWALDAASQTDNSPPILQALNSLDNSLYERNLKNLLQDLLQSRGVQKGPEHVNFRGTQAVAGKAPAVPRVQK